MKIDYEELNKYAYYHHPCPNPEDPDHLAKHLLFNLLIHYLTVYKAEGKWPELMPTPGKKRRPVEFTLTINGVEVEPYSFLKRMATDFDRNVDEKVKRRLSSVEGDYVEAVAKLEDNLKAASREYRKKLGLPEEEEDR
jgi:hypothetical protein